VHSSGNNGHGSVRDYSGYGSIHHLFSRTLYGQIERGNLRNRRKHSFDCIRTRLVLIDFILDNPEAEYLETEQGKVTFFCEKLNVAKEFLPGRVYEGGPGSRPTFRYFVDKFPLFLGPFPLGVPTVVTLSYVDSGLGTISGFLTHLAAYQSLFRQPAGFIGTDLNSFIKRGFQEQSANTSKAPSSARASLIEQCLSRRTS
jgi:hypothetical protein